MSVPSNSPTPSTNPMAQGTSSCFYSDRFGDLNADRNVGLLIRQLHILFHRIIDLRTAPLGLTANQWRPLLLIEHKGMDTPAELARAMNVDSGAITRMLDRLEAKKFVRRERCDTDRRVVKISVTDEGLALSKQVTPIIADVLNLHLQGFSEDEIRMLLALLKRMITNGEQALLPADTPPSAK
ncbi:MarR family winged helix-turn-helix transcriptional regulator [Castellaniella sp.]|uniref:MarR family winged helix-turn-helix transcriptional regulator n=1 Tax=Castellaniella sp. TaxID=1955812 RepID=UPI003C71B320